MAAISNIHPTGGGIPPVTRAAPERKVPEVGPQAATHSVRGNGASPEFHELADRLAGKLELLGQGHRVAVRWDEERSAPIIQVLNKEGKVLNQFPPEKILNLRRVLAELSGMVINRTT